jgi:UrcA family protein
MKTHLLVFAAVSCCLPSHPAFASAGGTVAVVGSQSDAPNTIHVSYRDLSLTHEADADVLRGRVKRAAWQACGALSDYDNALLSQRWSCLNIAWRASAPQIASAVERAKAGRDLAERAVVVRFAGR